MTEYFDTLGLPIGFPVEGWTPCEPLPRTVMDGRFCSVEPVSLAAHSADLNEANLTDQEHRIWTYLAYGPFESLNEYRTWMESTCLGDDPLFHAIVAKSTGKAVGIASYLRIEPAVGVIETGHINYSPLLQRSPAATEAMYLMMRRVFDELGYRRYEWKCDSLNARSRRAAERLGFVYEGTFRQVTLYKGRNRDTAWYSVTDKEWPELKAGFEAWLSSKNFDSDGRQRRSLTELRAA